MLQPGGLAKQRCFHHDHREAVAVCLECGRYFCRECITEHDGRVVCAGCLGRMPAASVAATPYALVGRICIFLLAFLFLWALFFHFGQLLLKLPASFHEGTLWKELWQSL